MIDIVETIIVEGKDDRAAVLAAVNANIICTSGYGLNDEIIALIKSAYEGPGIIIFTDPDHAGRKIRERLTSLFPNAKQAFLTQSQAEKKGDIGIENANPVDIVDALIKASAKQDSLDTDITIEVLNDFGLLGSEDSAKLRQEVGAILGIGYANSKSFLKRLKYMGISVEALKEAMEKLK